MYVVNTPTEAELRRFYSFDAGYKQNIEKDSKNHRKHLSVARNNVRRLAKKVDYNSKPRVLDIGCANGLFMISAQELGCEVKGIEFSEDLARIARNKYGLDVITGTIDSTSLEPESFDVVTLWDVIEHTTNPLITLRRTFDVLRFGGLILLTTPNVDGLFPRLSYWLAKLSHYWPHPEPPAHLFQFSETTISLALKRVGFDSIEICHERIPISYTFGGRADTIPRAWNCLYRFLFIPIAWVAPFSRAGDSIFVVGHKPPLY